MAQRRNARAVRAARPGARTRMLAAAIGVCAAAAAFTSTYAQFDREPTAGQLVLLVVATVLSGGIATATTFAGDAVVRTRTRQLADPVPIAYVTADEGWAAWVRQELRNLGYPAYLDPGPLDGASERPKVALLSRTALARGGDADTWFAAALAGGSRPVIARVDDVPVPEDRAGLIDVELPELTAGAAGDALAQALLRRGLPVPRPPAHRDDTVPFPGRGPSVTNLPPRNTDFTGRTDLLERLHRELVAAPPDEPGGQIRSVALHGMGGVGKSQTALEFAHRYAAHYDLTWWVSAERPSSIMTSLLGLAHHLGLPETPDRDEALWRLWAELRRHDRWLIVFDSAPDAEALRPYWPSGDGHVVVTSRSDRWDGLVAGTVPVDVPGHDEAVRYLCRRSRDPDTAAARDLARELDRLPLALAQAASYVHQQRGRLRAYLELLSDAERKAALLDLERPFGYEHTVLRTWSLSIEEADRRAPGARDLLTVLCFLAAEEIPRTLPVRGPDALPESLAGRLRDQVAYDEMIGALAGYSLINAHADGVSIHHLVQFAVRTGLPAADRARWAGRAVRLAARAFPSDVDDVRTWPACARLLPHALTACEFATEYGVARADAGDLLRRAATYLDLQGDAHIAEPLLDRALELDRAEHGPRHPAVARTLRALALARFHQMRTTAAREAFEEALAIAEDGPDDELLARTLADFAEMLREIPDLATAEAAAVRALDLSRALYGPDDIRTAPYYQRLGVVRWRAGTLEVARRQHGRALGIHESTGDAPGAPVVESAKNLGIICRDLCRFEQAEHHLARAARLGAAVYGDDHLLTLDAVMHLADVRRLLGDPEEACRLLERVRDELRRRLGGRHTGIAGVRTKLGAALRDLGRLDEARDVLTEAAEAYTRARGADHPYLAETLVQLGPVHRLLGDPPAARHALRTAEHIFTAAYGPQHPALAEVYDYLIPLLRETGSGTDTTEADRLTERVIELRTRAASATPDG